MSARQQFSHGLDQLAFWLSLADGYRIGGAAPGQEPRRASSRLGNAIQEYFLSRRDSARHTQYILAVKVEVAPLAFREYTNVYAALGLDAHALQ